MKETAEEWLEKAEKDLDDASFVIEGERDGLGAFLLQQALEKALKSLHIQDSDDFPRTHNLVRLARSKDIPDRFSVLFEGLTTMYTAIRYPDVPEDEIDDSDEKRRRTEEFLRWTKKRLQP